ncbi:Cof-type HAD-IIB family hydrolase [Cytobacillus sp. Hz8]|uniref:Cof-type HAD-IIB family hydrolase n=1 Tax=Cytobacillus sp. Hz8 TaxID=3347168 RepID=UPI0035E373A0
MVKLIAVDLDGTLLNDEKKISKRNTEAIQFAQSQGIEVVVATGRAHFDVEAIFQQTDIQPWIISANGATIHQPNGEPYYSNSIPQQEAKEILEWLEQEDYYYEVSSNDSLYTPIYGRSLLNQEMEQIHQGCPELSMEEMKQSAEKQYSQTGFVFIHSYKELLLQHIDYYNILAYSFDKVKLQKLWKKFEDYENIAIVKSHIHNFEFQHQDVSKGNALRVLANKLKINLVDSAAVGDNFNDLSMFEIVGKSAAMGNASEDVKKHCDFVTLTNKEDGVAYFIDSLIQQIQCMS